MNLKVNVKFPQYLIDTTPTLTEKYLNSQKMNIESVIFNIFSHNIVSEKYSKTSIEINVEIYEFACDPLSYAIMGVSQALSYANIEQKGLITCSNVIVIDEQIIVDPTIEEEKLSNFKLIFGAIMDLQENNIFLQQGFVIEEIFKLVMGCSIKICEKFQDFFISKFNKN